MDQVERIKCGNSNCYIISQGGKSILIDTATQKYRDKILACCEGKNIQLIILTHTHMDHCFNAAALSKVLQVSIAICKKDEELIEDNLKQKLTAKTLLGKFVLFLSTSLFLLEKMPSFEPDLFLKEGDSLDRFGIEATIIELPGHTNGSIGIEWKEGVIVGDALMNMFYPTVSMLYHDELKMRESAQRISNLGDKMIYFGHGKPVKNREWL